MSILLVILVITIGLGTSIPKLVLNDLFVEFFDEGIEFRQHNDYMLENLTGVMSIHYNIECGEPNCIFEPRYLEQLNEFKQRFKTDTGVGTVLFSTSVILVAGFATLAQSSFTPSIQMAFLISMTITLALVATFFLLPSLVLVFDRKSRQSGTISSTEERVS
ncbi:MAG TPA: hypothetical protein DCZ03_09235 [Gammaproteobacteria bacterium]|nr:hypothetical protein [Gammaproteobacteria bacterium]